MQFTVHGEQQKADGPGA